MFCSMLHTHKTKTCFPQIFIVNFSLSNTMVSPTSQINNLINHNNILDPSFEWPTQHLSFTICLVLHFGLCFPCPLLPSSSTLWVEQVFLFTTRLLTMLLYVLKYGKVVFHSLSNERKVCPCFQFIKRVDSVKSISFQYWRGWIHQKFTSFSIPLGRFSITHQSTDLGRYYATNLGSYFHWAFWLWLECQGAVS
jgi:hypothetical protein